MTQEKLAEVTGLQNTYIGGIELGERNISLETFEKVAKGLNIEARSLLDFQHIEIEEDMTLSIKGLLDVHKRLLETRSEDEVILVHQTVKNILNLLDGKRNK
ncbi:helix-turn-helix domain-containing protein [Pseudoneobacillus sp. C159]